MFDEKEFLRWFVHAPELQAEIEAMNEEDKAEAFSANLKFGTGGLRGKIGPGPNRLNTYTVAKASQGLADYLGNDDKAKVAIGYDTRRNSRLFAETAASVFTASGIKVYLYSKPLPTPCLSFATRFFHCSAGVMITASHNPAEYNGYKVYDENGCQITDRMAKGILDKIEEIDIFDDVQQTDFAEGLENGHIQYIGEECLEAFLGAVNEQSLAVKLKSPGDLRIVYTPLNGTGLEPVRRMLLGNGFSRLYIVSEQMLPDENFTTCPYPNPESKDAWKLAIRDAKKYDADLILATDPDSDRLGVAIHDKGQYRILTGNEVGVLLFDYLSSNRRTVSEQPSFLIKTIVTAPLADRIAKARGVAVINVLTGFKYIGEQIALLEKQGRVSSYLFGFEESCGFLRGSYVRDKDAVAAALMVCELCAYFKEQQMSMVDRLMEIQNLYGYQKDVLHSYSFTGLSGMEKMKRLMSAFRNLNEEIGEFSIFKRIDYLEGVEGLPISDALQFVLGDDCSVVIRPSGTEPKLKIYISAGGNSLEEAEKRERSIAEILEAFMKEVK